jgi:hypothetical protein
VDPARVLDAGACWLERAAKKHVPEPEAAPELRDALEAKDPAAAAEALVECDRAAPIVLGENRPRSEVSP